VPEVVLEGVTKRFRQAGTPPRIVQALDGVDLTIRDGETMAVLGPSGCGKTTLLRVIAGLEQPDAGRVLYDSVDQANVPVGERGIGVVFENYALYPHMQSRDIIGFFFKLHKREEEIDPRIRQAAEILGVDLRYLLRRKPGKLSGGERQLVAVGRCIARDARLFLFDEPLSNLDAKIRTGARMRIKKLLDHFKLTAVYVTHNQTEAVAVADRIAIMGQGRIVQVGTYRELYDQPNSAFVAGFLGLPPMSFFEGFVQTQAFVGSGIRVPLPPSNAQLGQAVLLGVRPEDILLDVNATAEAIPATVERIENLPSEHCLFVYLEMTGQPCVARTSQDMPVRAGDQVWVQFRTERLHLFDSRTGHALRIR